MRGLAEAVEPDCAVRAEDGGEGGERRCGSGGEERGGAGGEGVGEQRAETRGMGSVGDAKVEEGRGVQRARRRESLGEEERARVDGPGLGRLGSGLCLGIGVCVPY